MNINIDDLKFKFKFRDDPEMPATMTLTVGQFEIRGFRVLKTKFDENTNRYYMKPPANKAGSGKWVDLVWVNAPKDWRLLEKLALAQFDREQTDKLLGKLGEYDNREKTI